MSDVFYLYNAKYSGVDDFANRVCVIAAGASCDGTIKSSHLRRDGVIQTNGYWEFQPTSGEYGLLLDQKHGKALVADIRNATSGLDPTQHTSAYEVLHGFEKEQLAMHSLFWRMKKVGTTREGDDVVRIISSGGRVLVLGHEENIIYHQNEPLVVDWTRAEWIRKVVHDTAPPDTVSLPEPNVYYNIKAAYAPSRGVPSDIDCYLTVAGDSYTPHTVVSGGEFKEPIVLGGDPTRGNAQFRFERGGGGSYQLFSRNSGWNVGVAKNWSDRSHQRWQLAQTWEISNDADFDRSFNLFEIHPCGEGRFRLYSTVHRGWVRAIGNSGLGHNTGLEIGKEYEPGAQFSLVPAKNFRPPEAHDILASKYRDEPEDYVRMILGGLASIAGGKASDRLGVPGGATVCAFAFNYLWPRKEKSQYQIFQSFREDILADVNKMLQQDTVKKAHAQLNAARGHYLANYLTTRGTDIDIPTSLAALRSSALTHAEQFSTAISTLLPPEIDTGIEKTAANVALAKASLPLYVVGAGEYINALQEWALICAYKPSLVMPDIFLKASNGQYLSAENGGGGRVTATGTAIPLDKRVGLNKPVSVFRVQPGVLHSGDQVFLRAPNFLNLSATEGGNHDLLAVADHVAGWETFTLEKVGGGGEIQNGDRVSLRTASGHYLSAKEGGGGAVGVKAPHVAGWETWTVEVNAAPTGPDDDYEKCIASIAQNAASILERIRTMYTFILEDRKSKIEDVIFGTSYYLLISVVDRLIDKLVLDSGGITTAGYYRDAYKEHLAYTYYNFTYRYYDAAKRLETVAAETRKMCEEMRSGAQGSKRCTDFRFQARRLFQMYPSA